jgi:multiple sugar transport system substrate-binding protein
MSETLLRGITWSHSRALPPLVAASQRYEELHRGIRIVWEKRSLDSFGHDDLSALARSYDLLIVDHPIVGDVHRDRTLADLRPILPEGLLADLESDALGMSLASYDYEGCLYALPVDAAAPAASFREDLLARNGYEIPSHWEQLIELAQHGLVRMPAFPADLFLNFMGMCASRSGIVLAEDLLFDRDIAIHCLDEMRELASHMPESIYALNPIALYETMASGNEFAYCPFAYTYSNYSRPGFAPNTLNFANPVLMRGERPMRTVLGGTGIAVSAQCKHIEAAVLFCCFVAGRQCQGRLYGICGGQPASRSAWCDPLLNQISNGFFERTRASLLTAYVRPRYPGYLALQRSGGKPITEYLRHGTTPIKALESIEQLYRRSRSSAN